MNLEQAGQTVQHSEQTAADADGWCDLHASKTMNESRRNSKHNIMWHRISACEDEFSNW
jgi:hypothetical protein